MRDVLAQVAGELQSRGGSPHQHHRDGRVATVLDERDALVGE